MPEETVRTYEVAFCAEVSKWADKLFETNSDLPFGHSDIESYGRGSMKRQDFRVYERSPRGRGKLALCGEVKLPGTPQGRTPFDLALMKDAFDKATAANCRYFFTWNVERLALFDRKLWDADTMHERCIGQWELGEQLNKPGDVAREAITARIRDDFLPRFFSDFGAIWSGRVKDFAQAPHEFYVAVLESHLGGPMGPVRELVDYLQVEADRDRSFDARLRSWMVNEQQWNFDRNDPVSWRETIDRAARSMVYVLSNRILFYLAVRLRNALPELKLPRSARTPERALAYLRDRFQEAVDVTGDYEPVFFPEEKEWAALMALSGGNSLDAWSRTIAAVDRFNFKEVPTDILGHVFQKLISPEERHKFGQHYTDEHIVDLINAFCIRSGEANVFDPACGSGSFLVRAYYRKGHLDRTLSNQELLEGLYGCDINAFPAHLATLNLAARNISNEENYPRIVRKNFFSVAPGKVFCELPKAIRDRRGSREREKIEIPTLDAIIGNPPYVRHENIPKRSERGTIRDQSKEHIFQTAENAWRGISLSKQSDLHVYFWPVAAQFLDDDGWFGFLTSSSWLDVRYGFALQRWILSNFRLVAIIESVDEPWFEDARVKTAVTVMQRCADYERRDDNLVRFVRLNRPLKEILGKWDDEEQRQRSAEDLRDIILKVRSDVSSDAMRVKLKRQGELWDEGLSAGQIFAKQKSLATIVDEGDSGADEKEREESDAQDDPSGEHDNESMLMSGYGGGKWGRYLRAPDFYFEIMDEFGQRFTRLGEVATIKFGIKSGCDAFFMPRNVSRELLVNYRTEAEWRDLPLMKRCKREEVASGDLVVVRCGDNTLHPIEARFVRPEVHSLMQVDRPVVSADQLDRVVLWASEPLKDLKGTYVHHFITWGAKRHSPRRSRKAFPFRSGRHVQAARCGTTLLDSNPESAFGRCPSSIATSCPPTRIA
jgi:hypothetical protein